MQETEEEPVGFYRCGQSKCRWMGTDPAIWLYRFNRNFYVLCKPEPGEEIPADLACPVCPVCHEIVYPTPGTVEEFLATLPKQLETTLMRLNDQRLEKAYRLIEAELQRRGIDVTSET
jgi:hypothetical protein